MANATECTPAFLANATDTCFAARLACGEVGAGSFGSYIVHWYCTFHGSGAAILPLGLWLLMVMLALCSTADTWLIPQLNYISELLRLKPDVAGVTLLAFGNGAADVFTGIAVTTAHPEELDYSLMLSYQVGATVFIFTVVVGTIIWIADKHAPDWKLSRMPFYRDSICCLVAILVVLGVSLSGTVYAWEAFSFLVLYLIYVALVVVLRYYVQPCWPDDTFGVFVSAKSRAALRAVKRSRLGQRATAAASPLARRLPSRVRNGTFLANARQNLLSATTPRSTELSHAASDSLSAAPGGGGGGAAVISSTGSDVLPTCVLPTDAAARPLPTQLQPVVLQPLQVGTLAADLDAAEFAPAYMDSASPPAAQQAAGRAAADVAERPTSPPTTTTANALVLVDVPFGGGAPAQRPDAQEEEEEEEGGIDGIDFPSSSGRLGKLVWALELPLSVLRWGSIVSDAEWDERRRKWFIATPAVGALILSVELCGGAGGAWEARVGGGLPWLVLAPLVGSPFCLALRTFTRADTPPRALTLLVCLGFVMSIIWLDLLATEVVALIEAAGFLLGISTSILGLTIIAIGNSAGDLVANIAAARGASAKMAIAACFGSPLLMNLIGIGAALSVRMAVTGGTPVVSTIDQKCRIAFLFLFAALLSHLVAFPLGGYRASRRYAAYLFALYAAFILLALLAEGGLLGDFMM